MSNRAGATIFVALIAGVFIAGIAYQLGEEHGRKSGRTEFAAPTAPDDVAIQKVIVDTLRTVLITKRDDVKATEIELANQEAKLRKLLQPRPSPAPDHSADQQQ